MVTRTENRPKKDFFDILKDELLDDYDHIIREAREAKGWSQEDLAENIKEITLDDEICTLNQT